MVFFFFLQRFHSRGLKLDKYTMCWVDRGIEREQSDVLLFPALVLSFSFVLDMEDRTSTG